MIVVKLMGGLGNQLFQYALGRKLALLNNSELFLELSFYRRNWFKRLLKNIYRLLISFLKTGGPKQALADIRQDKRQYDLGFFELDQQIKKIKNTQLSEVKETQEFVVNPHLLTAGDNLAYRGYFISEKYFADIADLIRGDLTLKENYQAKLSPDLIATIKNCEAVALHVRRGDYLSNPSAKQTFADCSLAYYQQAINLIKSRVAQPKFFVFSDDLKWCRQNLNFDEEFTFVPNKKNYEALYLMSLCQHQIIANSTFSWWGAWLNSNPNKIVISPKNWLKDQTIDTRDLLPADWLKI